MREAVCPSLPSRKPSNPARMLLDLCPAARAPDDLSLLARGSLWASIYPPRCAAIASSGRSLSPVRRTSPPRCGFASGPLAARGDATRGFTDLRRNWKNMAEQFDVVVIGAGPAGTSPRFAARNWVQDRVRR